ncbi:preprotein translocase subunit SecA [Candidatus Berkelbacteria bacterium]|nr:preprotein translocase subunit SecA [Candidatus Berkelbacteria bacterium]
MIKILSKFFGDLNTKEVNKYSGKVEQINAEEAGLEKLTDKQLTEKSNNLKQKVRAEVEQIIQKTTDRAADPEDLKKLRKKLLNELLENFIVEAFALVREASKRSIGLRHFDVQLIGGMVLHDGKIAEMQTGEGKTLVASLPLYLNALTGLGVHLVTVNDYLARRDAGWMAPIFHLLGLEVGVIGPQFSLLYDPKFSSDEEDERLKNLKPVDRKLAYQADITYCTNNELGFDYLRDNMANSVEQLVQKELHFAIVDEVDSILIDEARTPLIISSFSSEAAEAYVRFAKIVPKLKNEEDFKVDEKARSISLTDAGIAKLESLIGVDNLYSTQNTNLVHYVDTALKAFVLYKKNKDYVVKDGEVVIVDEFTGRMLAGRRYSEGLHQALEAKEGVNVQQESITLATITFQNYFRLYTKLSGMTGTAVTEAEEFSKIYHLEVVSIPTNRQSARRDLQDLIYKNEDAKFKAIAEKISELQQLGQPVLVGTVSIAKSEKLSKFLKAKNIKHSVLNAKQHQKEGLVVAQAGKIGSVTVATNMAGRGVDIVLGGAPPSTKTDLKDWEKEHQKVLELGGLYVIGTERHESRRIDNQLRGRSGRQGDPGVSQFYISTDDDLMRIFGGDRMKNLMERLNVPDDVSINNPLLSRAIEQAQSRVEGHNFDIRKQLVEYDDVTNKQRSAIYRRRQQVLSSRSLSDFKLLLSEIESLFNDEQLAEFKKRIKGVPEEIVHDVLKAVSLRSIDVLWVEHLKNLENLRESIGLRGYSQKDPIVEYKQEAYRLYSELEQTINEQIIDMLLRVEIKLEHDQPQKQPVSTNKDESVQLSAQKIGRNDPCPCGAIDPKTGKVYKYKKCGLINAPHHQS